MRIKHIFDTASQGNYSIAKRAAEKAGMGFSSEYRANCCKRYHFEITAATEEQCAVLTNIILATWACPEQDIYRKKLSSWIAEL